MFGNEKIIVFLVAFFRQANNTPSILKRSLFFLLPSSGKQTIHQAFFLLLPFSSKQSEKRIRIAVSPSVQDFTSIVSRIVFSTSSGEELGHSVSKSFIFVTPCVFWWMFHFAQMLKEMPFWHDMKICGIFFPQCFFFQFDILLGHLLASFQQSSSVMALHCFICLCQKSGKPVASKVVSKTHVQIFVCENRE